MDRWPLLAPLEHLTFVRLIRFFPVAFALHVVEELFGFTGWVQRYAAPTFTFREYLVLHLSGLVLSVVAAAVVAAWPRRRVVLAFFALMLAPGMCWNVVFHVGASAYYRAYCPGALTALTLYVPYFYLMCGAARREGLLGQGPLLLAIVVAAPLHYFDLGHNVFKAF